MTATEAKKRPLFSSLRFVVSLGMLLGVAGATALHTDDASAKPPKAVEGAGGFWACEFDSANGGTITTSETTWPTSGPKPDCSKVCENFANGTNCNEAQTTTVKGNKKAPARREKHKKQ